MKRYLFSFLAIWAMILGLVLTADQDKKSEKNMEKKSIYDFTVENIDGKQVKMSDFKGKVLLIVNVASECGYTYQYEGLQKIYDMYKNAKKDFVVLGFPSNDFGQQEPGTNEQIKAFCSSKFSVNFPMFAKITVKGEKKHELYRFLTDKKNTANSPGEISWNFNKFLVGKDGKVITYYNQRVKPESKEVTTKIDEALKVEYKVEK